MLTQQELISTVTQFAVNAHMGQTRKYSNQPYVEHPIRVMKNCLNYTMESPVLLAALLHDVLEDTAVTSDELSMFLKNILDAKTADETLKLVVELTDVYTKKNYPGLNRGQRRSLEIQRLSNVSEQAQTIKYADIIDKTDVAVNDPSFAKIFLKEAHALLQAMKNGNSLLRERALALVDRLLHDLTNHPHIS